MHLPSLLVRRPSQHLASASSCALPARSSPSPRQSRSLSDGRRERRPLLRQTSINSGSFRGNDGSPDIDPAESTNVVKKSLVGGNVHGSYNAKKHKEHWLKSPLFARQGQPVLFQTGAEASSLLVNEVRRRDPYQVDFLQCVEEAATDLAPVIEEQPRLAWVFKQLMEPELLITFRVPWQDDDGNARINRGYRIQYSSALGPYRGGLRFHSSMSHGSIRMLGWEQTLKNALTGFGFGGSKGGADFDPNDKSPQEIRRFCESFMTQLAPFVGPERDTLEGGRGVGPSELHIMHSTFERVTQATAHDALFGSVEAFPEASGYGSAYVASAVARDVLGSDIEGKRCGVSGSGRLARATAAKLLELGAKVVAFSDTNGYIYEADGFDMTSIKQLESLRENKRSIEMYKQSSPTCEFVSLDEGASMWESVAMDLAFPSLIHGDLNAEDAAALCNNGCKAVIENTDMACTGTAKEILRDHRVQYVPSKLATMGSVLASGQLLNSSDARLLDRLDMDHFLMNSIEGALTTVREAAQRYDGSGGDGFEDLQKGANIASFLTVASSPMYSPSVPMFARV